MATGTVIMDDIVRSIAATPVMKTAARLSFRFLLIHAQTKIKQKREDDIAQYGLSLVSPRQQERRIRKDRMKIQIHNTNKAQEHPYHLFSFNSAFPICA